MRIIWHFLPALTLAPVLALAEPTDRPVARSFYLFGPPIGVAPERAALLVSASGRPVSPNANLLAPAPAELCRHAARVAGRVEGVPEHLLSAIARIESGRPDGLGGASPWPWSINVEGIDHVYDSKAEAVAAVRVLQAHGTRSIDVGCLQVNLMYHPYAFAGLEQAFDPATNAAYAARFLAQLRDQTGSWEKAVGAYHSGNAELGDPYRRKVMAALPLEQRIAAGAPMLASLPSSPGGVGGGANGAGMIGAAGGLPPDGAHARMLPLAASAAPGRDLAAYRLTPIQIVGRARGSG